MTAQDDVSNNDYPDNNELLVNEAETVNEAVCTPNHYLNPDHSHSTSPLPVPLVLSEPHTLVAGESKLMVLVKKYRMRQLVFQLFLIGPRPVKVWMDLSLLPSTFTLLDQDKLFLMIFFIVHSPAPIR